MSTAPSLEFETDSACGIPEDFKWDRLLKEIRLKQVIPIVGPSLVSVNISNAPYSIKQVLVKPLANKLGIDPNKFQSLETLACHYILSGGVRADLYDEIRELMEQIETLPISNALLDLVNIRDFDLFISTTFDNQLSRAMQHCRPSYTPTSSNKAVFHPSKPVDLPDALPSTFIYHVLGNYETYPDFAVWEEDFIEFICGLLVSPRDVLRNLFKELKARKLLIIGAPFNNWMVRFFLRAARQSRLSDRRTAYGRDFLADTTTLDSDPSIFYLDQAVGFPQIIPTRPDIFVHELSRRWKEKNSNIHISTFLDTLPDDIGIDSVFISYSRDDIDIATSIAYHLHAADIPVWLDKQRLRTGGEWSHSLQRAVKIRSALFISLISSSTETDPTRFVHQERKWAAERYVPGLIFYIPVVIEKIQDDMSKWSPQNEPEVFKGMHRYEMSDGKVSPNFISLMQKYLSQYKLHREIRDE